MDDEGVQDIIDGISKGMDFSVIRTEIRELKYYINMLAPGVSFGAEKAQKYIQMSALTADLQRLFTDTEEGIDMLMEIFAKHDISDYKKVIERLSGMKDEPFEEMEEATREKLKEFIDLQIRKQAISISKGPEEYKASYALEQAGIHLRKLLMGAEPLTALTKWINLLVNEYRDITEGMMEQFEKAGLGGIVAITPPLKRAGALTPEMLEEEGIEFTPGKIFETEEMTNRFWDYLEEKGIIPDIMDILGIEGEEGTQKGRAEAEALFFGQRQNIEKILPELVTILKPVVQEFWIKLLEEGLSEATRVPAILFWAMGETTRQTFKDDFLLAVSEETDMESVAKALKESGFDDNVFEQIKERVKEQKIRVFRSEQKIRAEDLPEGVERLLDVAIVGKGKVLKGLPTELPEAFKIDSDKNLKETIKYMEKMVDVLTKQLNNMKNKNEENKDEIIKEIIDKDSSGSDSVDGDKE